MNCCVLIVVGVILSVCVLGDSVRLEGKEPGVLAPDVEGTVSATGVGEPNEDSNAPASTKKIADALHLTQQPAPCVGDACPIAYALEPITDSKYQASPPVTQNYCIMKNLEKWNNAMQNQQLSEELGFYKGILDGEGTSGIDWGDGQGKTTKGTTKRNEEVVAYKDTQSKVLASSRARQWADAEGRIVTGIGAHNFVSAGCSDSSFIVGYSVHRRKLERTSGIRSINGRYDNECRDLCKTSGTCTGMSGRYCKDMWKCNTCHGGSSSGTLTEHEWKEFSWKAHYEFQVFGNGEIRFGDKKLPFELQSDDVITMTIEGHHFILRINGKQVKKNIYHSVYLVDRPPPSGPFFDHILTPKMKIIEKGTCSTPLQFEVFSMFDTSKTTSKAVNSIAAGMAQAYSHSPGIADASATFASVFQVDKSWFRTHYKATDTVPEYCKIYTQWDHVMSSSATSRRRLLAASENTCNRAYIDVSGLSGVDMRDEALTNTATFQVEGSGVLGGGGSIRCRTEGTIEVLLDCSGSDEDLCKCDAEKYYEFTIDALVGGNVQASYKIAVTNDWYSVTRAENRRRRLLGDGNVLKTLAMERQRKRRRRILQRGSVRGC